MHEANFIVEVVLDVEIVHPDVPRRVAVGDAAEQRHVVTGQAWRRGLGDERVHLQVLAEHEVRIRAKQAVIVRVAAHRLFVDEHGADA